MNRKHLWLILPALALTAIYAIAAGMKISSSDSIICFGTNAVPTRTTNEFVFGSANDLVTMPGQLSVSGPLTNYIAGYTGIGTNTPSEKFEVLGVVKAVGNLQNGKIRVQTYGTNVQSYLALDFARGSMANPLAVQTGDTIGQVVAVGHDGSAWQHGADMRFLAAQNWTGSTDASTIQLWAVPYNSTTEGLAFSVLPVYGSANFASTASYAYGAGTTTTAHALINGLNDAGTGVALDFISAANLSYPCGRIDVTRPSSATASRMTFSVINPSSPFQLLPAITIETNRNVGIGTNAPSEKLEVLGNIKASGAYRNGLTVGSTTYIDANFRSQTNQVAGALTFSYCTNGVHGVDSTTVRWLFNSSGSDQTLSFPIINTGVNGWRTNVFSPVPPAITNGTIMKVILDIGGPTDTLARQTNCYVKFEYYQ